MSHLKEEGMTYFQHMKVAWSLSFKYFVHGIFPDLMDPKLRKKEIEKV